MKKKNTILIAAVAAVVIGGAGAYAWFDRYVGNNVEIESVLSPLAGEAAAEPDSVATAEAGAANAEGGTDMNGSAAQNDTDSDLASLDGLWNISGESKVYWSVTTSRETVNFVNEAVKGSWNVNTNDAGAMTGEAVLDMTALDSGNGQRDGHVKSADYLDTDTYPEAAFTAQSISALPAEWAEGTAADIEISGILTVKGVEKEVTFAGQAMHRDGQLLLSATTRVTFGDFGMANPHTVVLETENDLNVQLELVLDKE